MDPIKLYICLNSVCGAYFSFASVFLISGLTPSLSMIYPSHSFCIHANLRFSSEIAKISSSTLFKTVFSVFC